ncbi:MAG: GDP-L-fucose synthase [Bauldia sp.]|uniref:GDP-L-fucose synthase n=1 Tax=Bauldia sp. TaxID=2575872 RepID=UPI001D7A758D|nr:GDP-L-fucose synthase [Bauldia sp.]MCB1498090.1 GDP-L-fucose synthase [Bauldia sp.]
MPEATAPYPLDGKRVWVAGHRGMVGQAVVRRLESEPCEVLTVDRRTVDLRNQAEVEAWLSETRPDAVVLAAAKVGGILANATYPADFLYDNLMIETNIIHSAFTVGVEKLLFLGSSCIYPKFAEQPIVEESLLTGLLEPTNEAYAIAKIAGIKLCQAYREQHGADFISAMPTNLYGPGDNFDLQSSHVLPALIRRTHEAKQRGDASLVIWGTGAPRREFLHVDDCAAALVFLLKAYSDSPHVNVGYGEDISILDLTRLIAEVVGYDGAIEHDLSKPDGTPRKLMSSARIRALGWEPKIGLREGIASTYADFVAGTAGGSRTGRRPGADE